MRLNLVTLFILLACMQVSADGFSQRISLKANDASLKSVLNTIEDQSGGYVFWYKDVMLMGTKKITLELRDASLREALDKVFKDQPVGYQIVDRVITIILKEKTIVENIQQYFASIIITGIVTTELGVPLPGVTVSIKGGRSAIFTDKEGRYKIQSEPNGIIVFSYIGYQNIEVATNGKAEINIKMQAQASQLEEMVIKGYYSTTKTLNTGTVNTLKSAEIARQPVGDVLAAMEGRIPGLYISQTSGIPGASLNVKLRGQNSLNNGNNPFYIVDGVPYNTSNISPADNGSLTQNVGAASNLSPFSSLRSEDIESIDVLKDADATAIYGSRGANGVILINTKKGKAGKTKVNANFSGGYGKVAHKLELMNTQQYLELRREGFANDNISPGPSDYDLNGQWDQNRYTDWQDMFIGGIAHILSSSLAVSGGNAQTQFMISGGYRKESTVFPGENSDRRGSLTVNVNHTSTNQKFKIDFSGNYIVDKNQLPQTDFARNIFIAPNAPALYKDNGELNWENSTFDNPFGALQRRSNALSTNLISNLVISYNLLDNLQLKTSIGYNDLELNDEKITPLTAFNPSISNPATRRSYAFGTNRVKAWIMEPQINYSLGVGDHHVDVVVGTTFQSSNQNAINQSASGYTSDALITNPLTATTKNITAANFIDYRYSALLARVGYNFKEKYVLNLTGRRDGSSRFGPGKQFGNFGAAGVAWIFSKEQFLKEKARFLSYGKLRASIGRTGNDQLPSYQYLSTYSSNSLAYNGISGLSPTSLTNENFGWETINKREVALELGMLKDRIHLDINYYNNRTKNQLVGYPLPYTSGFNTVQANLPAEIENKGLEFDLNTTNIRTKSFSWTSAFNISFPRNKLISYPNIDASSFATRYVVGQPLAVSFLFQYNGVDPQTGLYTFEDFDHDNQLSITGDRRSKFVGQKYFGGFNNSFNYKGFSLDVFLQFVKQQGFNFPLWQVPGNFNYNQPISQSERWRKAGDLVEFQRSTAVFGSDAFNAISPFYSTSSARIDDASFVRLKNVMLSWNIPASWQKKLKVQNVRVYIQGQNLSTLTNYDGFDPETNAAGITVSLPPLRIVNVGIQVTL